MHHTTFRSLRTARVLAALISLLAATALLSAAPASAAESGYTHAIVNFQFGAQAGDAGGYVSCPSGTRAVASGATSGSVDGYLSSGLTTFDGTGGFVTARGWDSQWLLGSVQCVAATRVAGDRLATLTVREHRAPMFRSYVRTVTCPSGTVAYGGGAFTSHQGTPQLAGLATFASYPGARSWTYGGAGTLSELSVSSHCLPRTKLGDIVTVTASDVVGSARDYPTVFAGARCPAGYFAFAGGAKYHPVGSEAEQWLGYLTTSAIAADDRGWFARGWVFRDNTRLTVTARCTNRLG